MPYKDKAKHLEAARRWWRKTAKKRKKRAPYKSVGWVIDNTDRCLHHAARVDYCRRKAKWRNGQWRACDLHKLPTDVPILFALKNMPQEAKARQPNCG